MSLLSRLRAAFDQDEFDELFDEFFRRYRQRVALAFPAWLDSEDRRDLIQEVFLGVYKYRESWPDDRSGFERWLYRLARNRYLSWNQRRFRAKRHAIEVPLDGMARGSDLRAEEISEESGVVGALLSREKSELLWQAIEALPRQMRNCVMLRVRQDLTYREIGQLLNLASGTVRAHLHAARTKLRADLEAHFREIETDPKDPPS